MVVARKNVYAFIGTKFDDPGMKVLNVITNVRPFSEPGDGPHYDRFADDARYSIHITNPFTGDEKIRYDFRFSRISPRTPPKLRNLASGRVLAWAKCFTSSRDDSPGG